MTMRPTRRGVAVVLVAAAGIVLAHQYGPRSLNAVVLSAAVAVTAAIVQVWSLSPPTAERDPPADGFPDATRAVGLSFATDTPFTGTVSDRLPEGVEGDADGIETAVGVRPVRYDVTLRERGRHTLGPVRVVGRDVLGLMRTAFTCDARDSVVVYPRVHALSAAARRDLRALSAETESGDRDEIDHLREYAPGDALRDVHWKSSAKHDNLVVKEFGSEADAEAVALVAGAADGHADEMAEAAASVGVVLLDADVPLRVATPDGEAEVATGDRAALLEHLAVASAGPTPERDADVAVRADADGVEVRLGDDTTSFDRLAGRERTLNDDSSGVAGVGARTRDTTAAAGEAP